MSYIKSILYEEYDRLKALSDKYRAEISALPEGTVSLKKRREKVYMYLAKRVKDKVKFVYIGPADSEYAQGMIKQIGLRKQMEEKLGKVIKDMVEIERVIHGRKI